LQKTRLKSANACLLLLKEFCANPRNVLTKRKRGLTPAVFKRVWQVQKILMFSVKKTQLI
jgi:hypothetical protein